MTAELILVFRYFRRHIRQLIGNILTIALFCTAILTMLLLTQSFLYTNEQRAYEYYGHYQAQTFFADFGKVKAKTETLTKEHIGVVRTESQIFNGNNSEQKLYIGYMDKYARKMRALRIERGRFPSSANEIAVDRTTYYRLHLKQDIGNSVTLTVMENGRKVQKKYTLTGIMSDYFDHWNTNANDLLNYQDPKLPCVLTGAPSSTLIAEHVIFPVGAAIIDVGGKCLSNVETGTMEGYINRLNQSSAFITLGIAAFFFILSLFGIWVLAGVATQNFRSFTESLDRIGITTKQRFSLYVIQGVILSVSAFVLSVPISMAILKASSLMADSLQITIIPVFSWWSFTATFLLIAGGVIAFFCSGGKRTVHRSGVNRRFHVSGSSASSFRKIWNKLYRRSKSGKNLAVSLLSAGCLFAVTFGIFSAELAGQTRFYQTLKSRGNLDYHSYVERGASDPSMLNASFPRNMGMSEQDLARLRESKDLRIISAYIDPLMLPAYILTNSDEKDSVIRYYMKNNTIEKSVNPSGSSDVANNISTALQKFGYKKDDVLVSLPYIVAVDKSTMLMLLNAAKVNTPQNWDDFISGKTVYALGTKFKKNSRFTVTLAVIPPGSTSTKLASNVHAVNFNVSVAASFSLDGTAVNHMIFPYGYSDVPCILISSNAVMHADPQLHYTCINANNAKSGDNASCIRASELIHSATAISNNMGISDRAEDIALWRQVEHQQKIPIFIMVAIMLFVILMAVFLLNIIRLKSNQHSYALLRAIGLESLRLQMHLLLDNLRCTLLGVLLGTAVSFTLCGILIKHYFYVPIKQTFINEILPISLFSAVSLALLTLLSCFFSIHRISKKSITESLQLIQY